MRLHFLISAIIFGGLFSACGVDGFAQKKAAPFGIEKRAKPTGTNLEVLLPKTVGDFKREDLPAGAKSSPTEDLHVEYKSADGEMIFFGFSITDTEKDAREGVKITRQEAIHGGANLKGEQYVNGKNPSYFKIANFMSWTRGRYFFFAKAASPQALERFMKAFPF